MAIDRQELIESMDQRSSREFLARMVRFKSYSNTEGEMEIARFMALSMLGLEAELQPVVGERVWYRCGR